MCCVAGETGQAFTAAIWDKRMIKQCRECQHEVSEQAFPAPLWRALSCQNELGRVWIRVQVATRLFGLPLLHISFKYRPNRTPVPPKGLLQSDSLALVLSISLNLEWLLQPCQFTIAVYAIAQFAFAYSLIAQIGVYLHHGYGQFVKNLLNC